MTKRSESDDQGALEMGHPEMVPDPRMVRALDPTAPLYGNEGYVTDHTPRSGPRPGQLHTREEWLAEATPAMETLDKGEAVSPVLIENLFHDAYHVIDEFVPPASRSKKKNGDDDSVRGDDEKKRQEK